MPKYRDPSQKEPKRKRSISKLNVFKKFLKGTYGKADLSSKQSNSVNKSLEPAGHCYNTTNRNSNEKYITKLQSQNSKLSKEIKEYKRTIEHLERK